MTFLKHISTTQSQAEVVHNGVFLTSLMEPEGVLDIWVAYSSHSDISISPRGSTTLSPLSGAGLWEAVTITPTLLLAVLALRGLALYIKS